MVLLRAFLLAPILIPQALWVMARAARLPEAEGPRQGTAGQGASLRVLILGDSSAAGVGVATQDQALAGQMCADLARDHLVSWHLLARSGATAARLLSMLDEVPAQSFDAAVICTGVNDVKNGVGRAAWQAQYAALLQAVQARFGVTRIVACGVPPMAQFPLLPSPLRDVLGARAAIFDDDLQRLAADHGAFHMSFDAVGTPDEMAPDGFHPGPEIYAAWGTRLAKALRSP